jgi:hypothetical protein
MMKFGVGKQFLNAATLLTYHSNEKKNLYKRQLNCDSFQIIFKMSFTADEYCNMYLALGVAENNAVFSCKDIHHAFC